MNSPLALLGVNDPYSSRLAIKRLFRHKTEKHFLVYILTALIFALNHEEPSSRDFTSDLFIWQGRPDTRNSLALLFVLTWEMPGGKNKHLHGTIEANVTCISITTLKPVFRSPGTIRRRCTENVCNTGNKNSVAKRLLHYLWKDQWPAEVYRFKTSHLL